MKLCRILYLVLFPTVGWELYFLDSTLRWVWQMWFEDDVYTAEET